MIKNKRGSMVIITFFFILFIIMAVFLFGALLLVILKYSSNTISPIMENLGVVGSANLSQAGQATFGTIDTLMSISTWMIGFAYLMALIGSFTFIVGYKIDAKPVFIGLYIAFVMLLIVFSIIMSNVYQNLYEGTGVIAQGLQEQTLLSYMILYSPVVMVVISLLTGAFIFIFKSDSSSESSGGYRI